MKNLFQRTSCLLLAFVLCLSFFAGLQPKSAAVEVDYQYSGKYIKNWGNRGETATYLSQNAEAFYTGAYSYDYFFQLEGDSILGNVPTSDLYKALQQFMADNHDHITSYNETRDLYQYTDCQNSGLTSNKISSFYSGIAIGPAWDGGSTWNREHTWPNSKGDGDGENDIMMLRPTSVSENSSRGNCAYGESANYYDPNEKSNGAYNLHGDVARIVLYVYVRWGNTANMWGSSGVIENKEVLLDWIEEDPVDTWELGRNDAVESITGTRNVFVDYPELAFLLFNEDIPTGMVTPSGKASGSASEYTVTATVSNPAHGSVIVNGTGITAFPAEGYQVCGYTIVSGEATVIRNNNIFIVTPASDCTIRVDFAAKATGTYSFIEENKTVFSQSCYIGDTITIPDYSGTIPAGYNFLGWVTAPLAETTNEPTTIYKVGMQLPLAQTTNFYALLSRFDGEATGGEGQLYAKFTDPIQEGDYILEFDDGAMTAAMGQGTRLGITDITIANDSVYQPTENLIWHIAPTADGYYTIYNESKGVYAASTGTKNQATMVSSVTDNAKWSISVTSAGVFNIVNKANSAKGINATLRRNSNYGFACYASSFSSGLTLYKRGEGAMVYTTSTTKEPVTADFNRDGFLTDADAIYLLWHTLFEDDYPVYEDADVNSDGAVSDADAIYLLWHTLFKDTYPLYP